MFYLPLKAILMETGKSASNIVATGHRKIATGMNPAWNKVLAKQCLVQHVELSHVAQH
jgi:hypothetical protein